LRRSSHKILNTIVAVLQENGGMDRRELLKVVERRLGKKFRISEHRIGFWLLVLERRSLVKPENGRITITTSAKSTEQVEPGNGAAPDARLRGSEQGCIADNNYAKSGRSLNCDKHSGNNTHMH